MSQDVQRNTCFICFVISLQDTENGEESEKMISRKEKSLGLLCHKFLARYPDYPNPALNNDICLDDVATELSTSAISTLFFKSKIITIRAAANGLLSLLMNL